MEDILHQVYFNNSVQRYLITLAVLLVGVILLRTLKRAFFKALRNLMESKASDTLNITFDVIEHTILPLLYVALFYFCITALKLNPVFRKYTKNVMMVVCVFFVIRIIIKVLKKSILTYLNHRRKNQSDMSQINGLLILLDIFLWGIGIMFLMGNMGYNISTILTGLGIGGIAIALAAQALLGDFFSYFVIFFDRPFDIGDDIKVDNYYGTVEKVGLKTTRLKENTGNQLIFANSDLTKSRVRNFTRMKDRRVRFSFGVDKQTPLSKLKEIPDFVNEIISSFPKNNLANGNMTAIAPSEFTFTFTYYILDADYTLYLDTHQELNYKILEGLEKRNIKLAYPTQSLIVNNESKI